MIFLQMYSKKRYLQSKISYFSLVKYNFLEKQRAIFFLYFFVG